MKLNKYAIIGAVAVLFAFVVQTHAIEGLQVSAQCSNVVLSWPSTEGETYIVQYRQTLSLTDSWTTLADYFPATSGTNVTCYVHSNIVQNPVCDGSSGSFAAATLGVNSSALAQPDAGPIALAPMAIRADGSGGAVPLALYPPGMDMSGFIIFDPLTGESVNGSADTTRPFSLNTPQFDGSQPLDGGGGSGNSMPESDTGFYRVVRDGAHLVGITNGMTLSGVVSVPIEFANPSGNVTAISITEDDSPVGDAIQTAPNISPLAVTLDTTQMGNGAHQISASVRWDVYGGTNDENSGGFAEADSPPVTVNVYNEISFPNWVPRFGELANSLFISVQSAHTDADWYIDVYDSEYSYIGTFAGHTYDGNIEGSWNLQGPYGEFHTSDNFFIFVVTTYFNSSSPATGAASNGATPMASSGSASAVTPRIYKVFDPWPGPGAWVVVAQHAWDSAHDSDLLYGELGGFIGGAQSVGWTVMPPPQGYNDYGSLLAYGLTFGAANPQGDTRTGQTSGKRFMMHVPAIWCILATADQMGLATIPPIPTVTFPPPKSAICSTPFQQVKRTGTLFDLFFLMAVLPQREICRKLLAFNTKRFLIWIFIRAQD